MALVLVLVSRFLTLVLLLLLSVYSLHCLAKCHVDDETGLLAFKSGITQDPSGMLSSWNSGTECCTSWSGVSCSGSGGFGKRVTSILLSSQLDKPESSLSGTISPSLSKIRYLTQFSVSGNRFTGSIPESISQLTQLSQLSLDHNLFTGQIPKEIQKMKNLAFLFLENNQFSGNISNFFASFSQLQVLRLSYNKLTGELPPTLSVLAPKLAVLEISHNVLTGKIPDYLGNFQDLYTLDLSSNQLTGTVPTSFKNLTRIANLNLRCNRLVGQIPELNSLEMDSLDLSYNKFNLGTIPKWVATSSMYSLKLSGCGLNFPLEDFKPTETFLATFIDLSDNQISGSPVGLLNQTLGFWGSGNQLRFNMSNLIIPLTLKNLVLARNQVFGKVPQSISGLKKVDLSHNHLCGQLPETKFPAEVFLGNDCLCGTPLPPCKKQGSTFSINNVM